jgi:hypothetical protein
MRLGRSTLLVGTLVISGSLLALLVARRVGAAVPPRAILVCAGVAVPLAVSAALQRLVHAWIGPPVESFSQLEAVRCPAAEAEAVRTAAQLRGTLGGAGHLCRGRLLVHATACAAAATLAGAVLVGEEADARSGWHLAAVAATGVGALLLPARPFFYREAMNGELLVTPPFALGQLVVRGSSPTPPPIASNPADVRLQQE